MILTPRNIANPAITLVDAAHFSAGAPIPSIQPTVTLGSVQIQNGPVKRWMMGFDAGEVQVPAIIRQATDLLAQQMLRNLQLALRDSTNQPFAVQFDDLAGAGVWDGNYIIANISAAQTSTDYAGQIDIVITMYEDV